MKRKKKDSIKLSREIEDGHQPWGCTYIGDILKISSSFHHGEYILPDIPKF